MSDYGNQRDEPIRASRDDVRPAAGAKPKATKPAKSGGGGFFKGGLPTLALAVVVLVSLGIIWKQSGEINELRSQFDELDALIKSTDESLSESGTALSLKLREQSETLDKHWSEIKKLWGVSYDRNRKAIEENKSLAEKASATAGEAKSAAEQAKAAAAKQQQALAQATEANKALQSELKALQASVKNLSNASLATTVQLEELEARLAAIDSLKKDLAGLKSRVADTEAGIKAMDVYRSQINQQLMQMRQKVQQMP